MSIISMGDRERRKWKGKGMAGNVYGGHDRGREGWKRTTVKGMEDEKRDKYE